MLVLMSKSNEINRNKEELPRPGSVLFNFNYQDEASRKKMLKRWKNINKYFMIPLYRAKLLPLLGFGKIFLILKTKGWKTGKTRRTPLEYRRYEGTITIFAARGKNATWLKNMQSYPEDVIVTYGFHRFTPRIEIISDIDQKITIAKWYVSKFGKAANLLFGWDPKLDNLENTNFSKLADLLSIVILHKDNN